MKITNLSNSQLVESTKSVVRDERKITLVVLEHLREIEKRKLYYKYGHNSLFAMVTKYFGYSESSALRRINSMRLIRDMPEAASKIESGELSLSTAATVQSFFSSEKMLTEDKRNVLAACANQSARAVEKELASRSPEKDKREDIRYTKADRLRMSLNISEDLYAKLETSKHKNGFKTVEDLLHHYVDQDLSQNTDEILPLAEKPKTRYISQITKKIVIKKNVEQRCEYVDPITKERCTEYKNLQFDHELPHSMGGPNITGNLRQLCGSHNRHVWHHEQRPTKENPKLN